MDSRFKPGQSGIPKGAKDFKTVLKEELESRIAVTENGRRKKISKRRAMTKQVVNRAVGGDVKATFFLFGADREAEIGEGTHSGFLFQLEDGFVVDGILDRLRAFDVAQGGAGMTGEDTEVEEGAPDSDAELSQSKSRRIPDVCRLNNHCVEWTS